MKYKEKSYFWASKSAGQNNAQAQSMLSYMYEYGEGTDVDKEKAEYWRQMAYENGIKEAQERWGDFHELWRY